MKRFMLSLFALIILIPLPLSTASPRSAPLLQTTPSPDGLQVSEERAAVEQAIQDALTASEGDLLVTVLNQTRIDQVELSQDVTWATAWLVPVDPLTGQEIQAEPGLAVVKKEGQAWDAILPSDPEWAGAVGSLPDSLLSADLKTTWLEMYAEQYQAAAPNGPLTGYLLPFAAGTKLVLTRSILHYNPPNPDGSMHYSFDFAAWRDSSGTSPMFPVYASKAGYVKYAVWQHPNGNEKYTNYVVLEDRTTSPVSFQVYLHLAQDSIPAALRTPGTFVMQGQYLGLADDTGISTGNHLHFQVHTNPSSYWGKSVDIVFSDVPINGGRPRMLTEAKYFPQYGSQGQTEYVSGNVVRSKPTPPTGDILEPLNGATVTSGSLHLEGWASDDDAGLSSAQFIAKYDGEWHEVGSPFKSAQFSMDWDLCADQVPDGPVSLALKLTDLAGSQTYDLPGLRHIIKNYACSAPPPCSPSPDQVAISAEADFGGACELFGVGSFATGAALGALGEDEATSIQLGENVQVTLSADSNHRGRSQTFTAESGYALIDSNLSDDWIGADTVSSLRVQTRSTKPSTPLPIWPADKAAFAAGSSISLSWEDAGGGGDFRLLFNGVEKDWQTVPVYHLGSLAPGTYKWQVKARNSAGESAWSAERTLTVSAGSSSPAAPVNVPFFDDMENGANGWTASGLWRQGIENQGTAEQDTSWIYRSTSGTYDTSGAANSGDLTTPPIAIPASGDYYLKFWYSYETEGSGVHWDQRWVQISVDGGPFTNRLQLADDPANVELQSPYISLNDYRGHTIQIRFFFETLDGVANDRKGWSVDDVSISSDPPPSCKDSYEANDTAAAAASIQTNSAIEAQTCASGDVDYYAFTIADNPDEAVLERIGLALDLQAADKKVSLTLLDGDGISILASGDDQAQYQGSGSQLVYPVTRPGQYYIRVRGWNVRSQDAAAGESENFPYTLRLYADKVNPQTKFTSPTSSGLIPNGAVNLTVSASDASSGINRVEFFYHSNDWLSEDWEALGVDWDASDGWNFLLDSSKLPAQTELNFYARAYDWAGNWAGAAAWNVRMEYLSFFPIAQKAK